MLIADGRGAANVIDSKHHKREIEIAAGAIGNFNRSVDSLSVHVSVLVPFSGKRRFNFQDEFLLQLLSGIVAIAEKDREFGGSSVGRRAGELPVVMEFHATR